jgi:hypothetical protein
MRNARALIEEVRRAFESGDFGRFPELVAPDAEIRNPFATAHGPAEFAEDSPPPSRTAGSTCSTWWRTAAPRSRRSA